MSSGECFENMWFYMGNILVWKYVNISVLGKGHCANMYQYLQCNVYLIVYSIGATYLLIYIPGDQNTCVLFMNELHVVLSTTFRLYIELFPQCGLFCFSFHFYKKKIQKYKRTKLKLCNQNFPLSSNMLGTHR
jgi:hypothetical protein